MAPTPRLIAALINLITTLIEGILGLRIILKLFGASTAAPIVRWTYETSEPLLAPFAGIFPSPTLTGGFVIEFSVLFALMVYMFIGYVAFQLIEMLMYYDFRREKQTKSNK